MEVGWDASAKGWIEAQSGGGDFVRSAVLDAPMLQRVRLSGAGYALDVGCGEGRFCRMLHEIGVVADGLEPTEALLQAACDQDVIGFRYVQGVAEQMPFEDETYDLVISYMSLIDIPDMDAAISEMERVLKPGGRILVANLQSYATAWIEDSIDKRYDGTVVATTREYLEERGTATQWSRIHIVNYHRPLSRYMQAFLSNGLELTHFDEPRATSEDLARNARYDGAPWALIMEWQKPG